MTKSYLFLTIFLVIFAHNIHRVSPANTEVRFANG